MRADVHQNQYVVSRFGIFGFGEHDSAIVSARRCEQPLQFSAKMVRAQPRVIQISRHPTESFLNLELPGRILPDQTPECAPKPRRKD
jgi:hypothetical protein